MACGATLKRHREFDPLQSSPDLSSPKRICLPSVASAVTAADLLMSPSVTMAHSRLQQLGGPAFVEAAQKLIHDKLAARMSPNPKERQLTDSGNSPMLSGSNTPPLVANPSWATGGQSPMVTSQPWHGGASKATTSGHVPTRKEQLFTMKQVEMICRNVLKDHEENVRGEFDNILTNKLAEQYEGLLRFNQAQIHNRFDNSDASYVS